jgi:hypothetical protein
MGFHPHLHCVVTGGALAENDEAWVAPTRSRFLFPVKALSKLFQGKFMDGLVHLYEAGALDLGGPCESLRDPEVFQLLKDALYRKRWVVYAKQPFGGPEQVFSYLGLYTHRVAISNRRLVAIDEKGVSFKTRDGKTMLLTPEEFIRRFLLHVLPKGFVKIRHYGLLAPCHAKTKLDVARRLLGQGTNPPCAPATPGSSAPDPVSEEAVPSIAGAHQRPPCPRCHTGFLWRLPLPRTRPPPQAAP